MYRIEVSPGEETVFRTIEEFSTGIRNGLVGRRSRIFHHASQKWLPIEFHPHYKKALEGATATPARVETTPAPVKHAPPPPKHAPPPPKHTPPPAKHAPPPAPLPSLVHPVDEVMHPVEPPVVHAEPETTIRFRRRSKSRPLELAVAGVALIVGTQFVLSAANSADETATTPVPVVRRQAQPVDSVAVSAASIAATPTIDPVSAPPVVPVAAPTTPLVPAAVAPRPTVKAAPVPRTATTKALVPAATARSASSPALLPGSTAAGIEPAPAEINLALPALLPGSDSISAVAKPPSDSNAIRRILRAVSGGKAPPARPSTP
ncbi:MAG: hypothetical protein ACREMX_02380 [Gemmatimonadales bacterium]